MIRVLVVDDHQHIHKAVKIILRDKPEIELVGHAYNGDEAMQLCGDLLPDVVLMDVVMPSMSGVEATQRLRRAFPQIKVLVLSSFQDDDSVRAMLEGGAHGYILKSDLAHSLVDLIRTTQHGQSVFSADVAQILLKPTEDTLPLPDFGLTERELEILRLMALGLNNGEIATQLVISQSTVKFHVANIIAKIGVETRTEAIVKAAKSNLI